MIILVIFILSLIFFIFGIISCCSTYIKHSNSVTCKGKIYDFKIIHDDEFSTLKYPLVEFYVNNEKYLVESTINDLSGLEVGSILEVIYNPSNPNIASINTFSNIWLQPLILVTLSLIFMVPSFIILVFSFFQNNFN